MLTSGSIGVGDTSPDARVHIVDSGSTDALRVDMGGDIALMVTDGGRVGITCEYPGAALEVHDREGYSQPALIVRHYGSYGTLAGIYSQSDPGTGDNLLFIHTNNSPVSDFQYIECHTGFGSDTEFKINGGGYYGPADFAEMLAVSSGARSVEAGDVMVIDPSRDRSIALSWESHSTLVAGVYSTEPGFVGSPRDWDKAVGEDQVGTYSLDDMATMHEEIPLAVMGIVPCKVSAENGSIRPGDLLVTSGTRGHAMRDSNPPVGTVIGKALGSLSSGTGVIEVLVTLQ